MSKHTPGPWYSDSKGNIWRNHPSDLYENGGGIAGDRPLGTAYVGWHGKGEQGYPINANARLIAAAPEILEALREIAELADKVDSWQSFPPEPIQKAYAAIAKATGEQA